ncbi:YccS family putative transporter [Neisseria leonii]|uniref:YccS family putative transporter n=2 Tax=Neisseria leonii TaxID=2995413 RepID=A0AAQ3XL19_9NEIS
MYPTFGREVKTAPYRFQTACCGIGAAAVYNKPFSLRTMMMLSIKTPPVNAKVMAAVPVLVSVCAAAWAVKYWDLSALAVPLVLGVVAGGLVDLDNRFSGRLKNMLISLSAFALSSLAVQLTFGRPLWFVPTMTLLAFVFTLIGVAGVRYRTIAFGTLAVAVYTTLTYRAEAVWYAVPLMICGGALLYHAAALLVHALFPHRPVQENVAGAYAALAAFLDSKAGFFDPDEVGCLERRQIDLAMKNQRLTAAFNQCRSTLFYRMRGQHRHPRTGRMLHYYFAAQDIHERAGSSFIRHQEVVARLKNSDLVFRCRRLLELQADACRAVADALRANRPYHYDERLARAGRGLRQSLKYYEENSAAAEDRHTLARLIENLCAVSDQLESLERAADDMPSAISDGIAHSDGGSGREVWQSLKNGMTLQSATFRHAVRMALLVSVCGVVVELLAIHQGYWIMLTAVFVCQPNYSATQTRLKQRIVGTLAGVLVGSLLPYFTPSLEAELMIVVASTTLFFFFRSHKYSYSTFFITIQALASFSIAGYDLSGALPLRLIDTVIGAALAWAAVSYLWPDWHYLQLNRTGAQAVAGSAEYLRNILKQLQQGAADDMVYRTARRQAHEKAAALSSTVSDMSGEPEKYGGRINDGFALLKINYSLLGYIASLGACRSRNRHGLADSEFARHYFAAGGVLCGLLENMEEPDRTRWQQDHDGLLADLAALRQLPEYEAGQNHLLWQQLSLIARVAGPAYRALHGAAAE